MYSVPRKNFAAFPTDSVLRKPKSVSDFRYPAVLSAIRPLYPQIFRLFFLRIKDRRKLRTKIVFPQHCLYCLMRLAHLCIRLSILFQKSVCNSPRNAANHRYMRRISGKTVLLAAGLSNPTVPCPVR